MATILVMRHGHAEASSPDELRELTPTGTQLVSEVGRALASMGVKLDTALHSPLVRTTQTTQVVLAASQSIVQPVPLEALRAGGQAQTIFDAMQKQLGRTTLVVGHMPDLSYLTGFLVSGQVCGAVAFAPGTVACVELMGVPTPGAGTLRWVMTTEQLIRQGTA